MNRRYFLLSLTLFSAPAICGCALTHSHCDDEDCVQKSALSKDIEEARRKDEAQRKTLEGMNEKKAPKGFLYGGLSSEARDIEDHLYGN